MKRRTEKKPDFLLAFNRIKNIKCGTMILDRVNNPELMVRTKL